jgi:hypothetical protein
MSDLVHVGIFGKPDLLSGNDIPIMQNDMRMQVFLIGMNSKKTVKAVGGKPFRHQVGYHIPEHLDTLSGGLFFCGEDDMRGVPGVGSGVFYISFVPIFLDLIEVVFGKH